MGLLVKGSGTVPGCIPGWLEDEGMGGCPHGLFGNPSRYGAISTECRGSTGFYTGMGWSVLGG